MLEPLPRVATQVRLRLLRERQEVPRVAAPQLLGLARLLQPFARAFADRLQHPEALAATAEQALVDERLQPIQVSLCDLLRGLERATASEHRQSDEEGPLFL